MGVARTVPRAHVLVALLTFASVTAEAQYPRLVRDFTPGTSESAANHRPITDLRTAGNLAYFLGPDAFGTRQPWVTDGTASGTRLLRAIEASEPTILVSTGELPVIAAGHDLHSSDGTASGTARIASPGDITLSLKGTFDGLVYFDAGRELWRSDGTPAGTTPILAWGNGRGPRPSVLTGAGSHVWFVVNDVELWRTDGTPSRTSSVFLFPAGTRRIADLAATTSGLFFSVVLGSDPGQSELWWSDGTGPGTRVIRSFTTRPGEHPHFLTTGGNRVFFRAGESATGSELWSSDGTLGGTTLVRDLAPGALDSRPGALFFAHGLLYFVVADPSGPNWLVCVTDGTGAGTRVLSSPRVHEDPLFVDVEGAVMFAALAGDGVGALWKTDGTDRGTSMLAAVLPCGERTVLRGKLVFSGRPRDAGACRLMTSDGVGVEELARFEWGKSSMARFLDTAVGRAFVSLRHDPEGAPLEYQLWATDGRFDAAELLGTFPKEPGSSAAIGERLAFVLESSLEDANELWITDGTASGTKLLKDRLPYNAPAARGPLPVAGGRVYFIASDDTYRRDLWVSDGTSAGAHHVPNPYTTTGSPTLLTPCGQNLFFVLGSGLYVSDGVTRTRLQDFGSDKPTAVSCVGTRVDVLVTGASGSRNRLWRSDGTPEGTLSVRDLGAGSFSGLLPAASRSYFRGGCSLWTSDGTGGGTLALTAPVIIRPPGICGSPEALTSLGSLLAFTLEEAEATSIRVSDGTPSGTIALARGSRVHDLKASGASLFFGLEDAEAGDELWITDGTVAGTRRVVDACPGPAGAVPLGLTPDSRGVFFSALDPEHGRELWYSDGTPARTLRLTDSWPGAGSSSRPAAASGVVLARSYLLFLAFSPSAGEELWGVGGALGSRVVPTD